MDNKKVSEKEFLLNDNDLKLLDFCFDTPRHVNEIARELKINPKNISVRLKKLKNMGEIEIRETKNKTFVRSSKSNKTNIYIIEILKKLKEKGEMSYNDFFSLVPFNPFEQSSYDKFNSVPKVYHSPYVHKIIKISERGEKFLKENSKK